MRMDGQPVYGAGSYTSLLLAACSDSAESDTYIGYLGMGIVQTAVVLLAAEYLGGRICLLYPQRGCRAHVFDHRAVSDAGAADDHSFLFAVDAVVRFHVSL